MIPKIKKDVSSFEIHWTIKMLSRPQFYAKLDVDHSDENECNNHNSNLVPCSKYNHLKKGRTKIGRKTASDGLSKPCRGRRVYVDAGDSDRDINSGRFLKKSITEHGEWKEYPSHTKASKDTGVLREHVSACISNEKLEKVTNSNGEYYQFENLPDPDLEGEEFREIRDMYKLLHHTTCGKTQQKSFISNKGRFKSFSGVKKFGSILHNYYVVHLGSGSHSVHRLVFVEFCFDKIDQKYNDYIRFATFSSYANNCLALMKGEITQEDFSQIFERRTEKLLNMKEFFAIMDIDHIDQDGLNNEINNLQILTRKEHSYKSRPFRKTNIGPPVMYRKCGDTEWILCANILRAVEATQCNRGKITNCCNTNTGVFKVPNEKNDTYFEFKYPPIQCIDGEIWKLLQQSCWLEKNVLDKENLPQVALSNFGRVLKLKRNPARLVGKGYTHKNRKQYRIIKINGKNNYVHRLVVVLFQSDVLEKLYQSYISSGEDYDTWRKYDLYNLTVFWNLR
jgi:hypothetical protein